MMPLWTTATRSVAIGWAFFSIGWPCVAQRVWPMPIVPCTGSRSSRATRLASLPSARRRSIWSPISVATPAEVIAAIFEAAQPLDQLGGDRLRGDDADDAAHQTCFPFRRSRSARARPGLSTWRARAIVSASAGTSEVTTLPVADIGAVADRDRRDQRGVRADKRALADDRAEFAEAVVVAGDRAGADIGPGADVAVAEIGEVTGLDAGAEPGRLDLDEIADMDLGLEHRTRAQPGKRANDRTRGDVGAFEMRERTDQHIVGDPDAGPEDDIGLDHDIAPEPGIGARETPSRARSVLRPRPSHGGAAGPASALRPGRARRGY